MFTASTVYSTLTTAQSDVQTLSECIACMILPTKYSVKHVKHIFVQILFSSNEVLRPVLEIDVHHV